jgi:3-methyladenine DNA glycosylase AlkD
MPKKRVPPDAFDSVRELHAHLKTFADPARARHSQRFFKTGKGEYAEGDIFIGITVPVLRSLVKRCKGISLDESLRLLTSPVHEERLLALFLLVDRFKKGNEEARERIYRGYLAHAKYVNNWDLVDSSAHLIVGAYLENRDKRILFDLAKSDLLWERRIAVIATFHLIRLDRFDDALRLFGLLICDKEDLIHKAVGWMLREIGKRDMPAEEGFLKVHGKQMPRTMLRYAIERFPEKKRVAYMEGVA